MRVATVPRFGGRCGTIDQLGMGSREIVFVPWQIISPGDQEKQNSFRRTRRKDVVRIVGTQMIWIALLT